MITEKQLILTLHCLQNLHYIKLSLHKNRCIQPRTEYIVNKRLEKLIAQGEHQAQDFKYCINDSKKIAKSLVAFANTDGGRLLIGVKDNGTITGVKSEEEYYMVEAAAKIYSKPAIDFSFRQWMSEGKTVLQINIPPGNERPHFAQTESGKWLAYTRKDDQNLLTSAIQLKVWEQEKSGKGVFISYSDNEKTLLDYLEKNQTITPRKFSQIAKISFRKAQNIIIDFILLDIMEVWVTHKKTLYRINENFNRKAWDNKKI